MPEGNRHEASTGAEAETNVHVRISGRNDAVRFLEQMLAQAQHQIAVFAPILDPLFFNSAEAAERLASFAAAHHRNLARFLVEDVVQSLQHNQRLIELCRRFSDFIRFQQVDEDQAGLRESFVIVDQRAFLHQRDLEKMDYVGALNARRRARLLEIAFDRLWDRSHPIAEIHSLGLPRR